VPVCCPKPHGNSIPIDDGGRNQTMSEDAAFVEEIRRNPDDVVPRLIYADYLEETGDARGELIRVQCQLSDLPAGDPQRAELFNRERELLEQHGERWVQPLRDLGAAGVTRACFSGGLLERVRLPCEAFLQSAERLCAIEPALSEIALSGINEHAESLAAMVFPEQIIALDLSGCRIDPPLMRQLAAAAWWSGLEHVDLRFNQLQDEGVGTLASVASVGAPSLRQLNLSNNGIGPAGVRELVSSHAYQRLVELDLSVNPVGDVGLQMLHRGEPALLKRLNLSRCGIASTALFRSGFDALEELTLRSNRISDWSGISARQRPLRVLDGRGNAAAPPT
jgi:uncharacterized protein (TIGR02996 family)